MSRVLKPCPFCGGKAKLRMTSRGYDSGDCAMLINQFKVYCDCGMETKVYGSKIWQDRNGYVHIDENGAELAVAAWNRRAE